MNEQEPNQEELEATTATQPTENQQNEEFDPEKFVTEDKAEDNVLGSPEDKTDENPEPVDSNEQETEELEEMEPENVDEPEEETEPFEQETKEDTDTDNEDDSDWGFSFDDDTSDNDDETIEPPSLGEDVLPETEGSDDEYEDIETWAAVSEDLGIDADSYEEFIEKAKEVVNKPSTTSDDDVVKNINSLLEMPDKKLVMEEYKRRGYSEEEVEDEIFTLEESRLLKREARSVRTELRNAVRNYKQQLEVNQQQQEAQRTELIDKNRKELWSHLSKTKDMFGGKINQKQKESHYKYIASGKFQDEITDSHQNITTAAWLWKYRDQIIKNMKSNGFEKGKKHVLDNLTNPDFGKKNSIPEPDTGDFNPNRFLHDAGDSI